jgi:hypothetical protein
MLDVINVIWCRSTEPYDVVGIPFTLTAMRNSSFMRRLQHLKKKTQLNPMTSVRVQTVPTERPSLVDEVNAHFCG